MVEPEAAEARWSRTWRWRDPGNLTRRTDSAVPSVSSARNQLTARLGVYARRTKVQCIQDWEFPLAQRKASLVPHWFWFGVDHLIEAFSSTIHLWLIRYTFMNHNFMIIQEFDIFFINIFSSIVTKPFFDNYIELCFNHSKEFFGSSKHLCFGLKKYNSTLQCPTDSVRNPVIPAEWHRNSTGIRRNDRIPPEWHRNGSIPPEWHRNPL